MGMGESGGKAASGHGRGVRARGQAWRNRLTSSSDGGGTRSPGRSTPLLTRADSRSPQERLVEIAEEVAAPATPHPNPKMKRQSSTQFSALAATVAHKIVLVSFRPRRAPMQTS